MKQADTTEDVEHVESTDAQNGCSAKIVPPPDDAFSDDTEDVPNFSSDAFRHELIANLKSLALRNSLEDNHVDSEPPAVTVTSSHESTVVPNSSQRGRRTVEFGVNPSIQELSEDSVASLEALEDKAHPARPRALEDSQEPDNGFPLATNVSEPANARLAAQLASCSEPQADLELAHLSTLAYVSSPASLAKSISVSTSLPDSSTAQHIVHRSTKSCGPSALEKVLSKTRPMHLPPKAKFEDQKHLADWESMMKQSRDAEEKKRAQKAARRLVRERALVESNSFWESHILPDWKSALRDEKKRQTWRFGIPPKLRGSMWEKVVGNDLALNKDNYRSCLARANSALAAGTFPTSALNLIDSDIRSTLPTLQLFTPASGPLYHDLKSLLCAWVVSRSDEGLGYVFGASKIAAMFLLNMQPSSAFVALRNFLERHCMRSFYGGLNCKDDVEAYYRIFDTLLADCMPKVYFNFKQHQVSPSAYLSDWLVPAFLDHLPLDACARIWDVFLLEGDSFLFRVALAILAALEPRLFFPDRTELLNLLRGENRAAIEIAKRDRDYVGACKYEIYGLDEEIIWNELQTLEAWWKESTWARLLQRELPDV